MTAQERDWNWRVLGFARVFVEPDYPGLQALTRLVAAAGSVGPHVMVVLPDSAKDALRGINQDLSNNQPYTSLLSSADIATPIWVIPVAKGGDRIKEEPAK